MAVLCSILEKRHPSCPLQSGWLSSFGSCSGTACESIGRWWWPRPTVTVVRSRVSQAHDTDGWAAGGRRKMEVVPPTGAGGRAFRYVWSTPESWSRLSFHQLRARPGCHFGKKVREFEGVPPGHYDRLFAKKNIIMVRVRFNNNNNKILCQTISLAI